MGWLNVETMRVMIYITRVVHEVLIRGLMGRYLWTYLQWAGLARMQVHSLLHVQLPAKMHCGPSQMFYLFVFIHVRPPSLAG